MDAKLEALVSRLENATAKLEKLSVGSGGAVSSGGTASAEETTDGSSPALVAFDEVMYGALKSYMDHSAKIGGLIHEQALLFQEGLLATRQLVATASTSKKPDQNTLQELIKPLQKAIAEVTAIKDSNRPAPVFSNLSAVADGVPALGWVVVTPTPAPYINEMKQAAQFYANRVIKENKDKNPAHLEWMASFLVVLDDLFAYVKKHHTTGLTWNQKGGDAKAGSVAQSAPAAPKSVAAAPAPVAGGTAFLSELGKGTSGLKKVDKSQMVHKNPELRSTSVVPAAAAKPVSTSVAKLGPPVCELQGSKWVVENQTGEVSINGEIRHVVYIYNCQGATIKVNGKINALTIDKCKKTGIVVENVVSTIDTVNSQKIQLQIVGVCPTAVVDKTDGYQLYLSSASSGLEFFSAKSSEINILVEKANGDYTELPVPEQFKTIFKDGALVTVPVEHSD